MPTINCPEGFSFSDSVIPSPYLHHLIADKDIDELVTAIMETVNKGEDLEARITYLLASKGKEVYKCPHCGRLLFVNSDDHFDKSYLPESKANNLTNPATS